MLKKHSTQLILKHTAAGGAERCAGLCVLIGTGLAYASIGMAGGASLHRQISSLTTPQVCELMASALRDANGLTSEQANDLLGHNAVGAQLSLLMGLPGFMDMALKVLSAKLKIGVDPQKDLDIRSAGLTIVVGHPQRFYVFSAGFASHVTASQRSDGLTLML